MVTPVDEWTAQRDGEIGAMVVVVRSGERWMHHCM